MFTDFRSDYEMDELHEQLEKTGFKKLSEETITPEVVKALELDDDRRRRLVKKMAPGFLGNMALTFAGATGTETYDFFVNGKYEYFSFVFQKE